MREVRGNGVFTVAVVWTLWCSIVPVYAAPPWLHVDGNKIKDPSGNAVVLRGVSLPDLGVLQVNQGGALTMIDRLTNQHDPQGNSPGWYPKILRIPILPADSTGWLPLRWSAQDDGYYTNLLRPVVDYCAAKNLYVIIDWHYIDDTGPKMAQTSAFWRYMAPRFANDSHVFFELFNEPMDNVGSERQRWLNVRADMQTWVNLVRSYAPDNLILVGGGQWCQILSHTVTDPIVGSNIVYVSHFYPAHWLGIYLNRQWIVNQLETCTAVHPVLMTEWGFNTTTETLLNGTITNYGRPLVDLMDRLGMGYTAWVASNDWRPPMFWPDWTLRCGEGEMGGFVKDTLYQKKNDDQPHGTAGFRLYRDTVAPGITASDGQKGMLEYDCQDQPAVGNCCIHWTGADQSSAISFAFTPAKDLSGEVAAGSVVELWARCSSPTVRLDLRFVDTKTTMRGDHPWRMRYLLDPGTARWNGEWNRLQLPLRQFSEPGCWDGERWYDPVGAFDWTAVDRFEIATDYRDLRGIHLYFDDIRVVYPGP
jgi:endoglucanase